eukprot:scaffold669_cov152-Isochrysis_galbana.AAC.4
MAQRGPSVGAYAAHKEGPHHIRSAQKMAWAFKVDHRSSGARLTLEGASARRRYAAKIWRATIQI